jgi:hypothetical protein
MAPKILLKDLKGGTKSQWNHRNEEYYKMVIKGLDRMTFEKVNDYIQKGWNSEAAHKQVLWDEEEALEKPEKEEDEMGKCPGCFRSFSNVHRRFKMSSGKCGHILCSSCVEYLYLLQRIKCSRFGCDEELRMSDWAKWQPVREAQSYRLASWVLCRCRKSSRGIRQRSLPPNLSRNRVIAMLSHLLMTRMDSSSPTMRTIDQVSV